MGQFAKQIKGECKEMCPESEIRLRENERLLHILETVPGTERTKKPLADRKRIVKEFSRSAAGRRMQDPRNLRSPDVLLKTINYLLTDVITNDTVPWHVTYDFIMDRLRAVRQDMVIQRCTVAESICILQPIVRFHAYAAYRLCKEPLQNFDPYINRTHLQECLKRLLNLYDEHDRNFQSRVHIESVCARFLIDNRPQCEALYLMLNLGNTVAINRSLTLPREQRNEKVIQMALEISLHQYRGNFVRVLRMVGTLPVLLQCLVVLHLPDIRKSSLRVMASAYNSKNLKFPLAKLSDILLYENVEQLRQDCQYFGLKCSQDDVQFIKVDYNGNKPPRNPEHLSWIDEALDKQTISNIVLNTS